MNNNKTFSEELHRKVINVFPRRMALSSYINDTWSADLLDISNYQSQNDGIVWLLVVIDNFSRYLWVEEMKDKSALTVLKAFQKIVNDVGTTPSSLWTDEGNEFYNNDFNIYNRDQEINHYHTYSGLKAVYAERVNRTLREKMNQHMTENKTKRYVDVLSDIVKKYNHTIHNSIHKTPYNVYFDNANIELKSIVNNEIKPRFKVGDFVRISKTKDTFEKGYKPNWTLETFRITNIDTNQSPEMYELEDLKGEALTGKFYDKELQITKIPEHKEYEKVVAIKKVGRGKQYLIHFKGWNDKFNEWVNIAKVREYEPNFNGELKVSNFKEILNRRIVDGRKQYLIRYKNDTPDEWVSFNKLKEIKKL